MTKKLQPALALLSILAIVATTTAVCSQMANNGGEQIKFPTNLGTMYLSLDRSDNKQLREYYATPPAIAAAKKGEPLPSGSVLTGVLFKAKPDPQGNPEKGNDGRFIKDGLIGYIVMEKQKGRGASVPAELRNGEWEYQAFTAASAVNDKANLKACYECHRDRVGASKDFVFTLDKIAAH